MIFEQRLIVDHLVLNYVIFTIIGLSLGWYIPEIAAIEKLHYPLNSNARRVQALETAAAARFGTARRKITARCRRRRLRTPAGDGVLRGPQEIAA